MNFLYPQFLFALFALSIPIIVHLFNFRRFKKVLFTNVSFLHEIKQDTKHRSRLKHLLILASRLLALAFLILAFAQPYIPSSTAGKRTAQNKVTIWVDNSFSMNAQGKYGPLLDNAKEKAREVAMGFAASDQYQLITNDFEARHQRFVNRDEFLQLLDEIKPTSSTHAIDEILRRQTGALDQNAGVKSNNFFFLLSDFQKGLLNAGELPKDTSRIIYLVPFTPNSTGNIFIDTCFLASPFIQPGTPQDLTIRIRNTGTEDAVNIPVKLSINGLQRGIATVEVGSGSASEVKLPFKIDQPGIQEAVVSLTDYPVTFDDTFYFSFKVRPSVQVLCINGTTPSPYLDALYSTDPYFQYRSVSAGQVDYSSFFSQQLIILNGLRTFASGLQQEIKRYMENGGTVFIIPSTEQDALSYDQFSQLCGIPRLTGPVKIVDRVSKLEANSPLLSGIFEKGKSLPENMDLPLMNEYFTVSPSGTTSQQAILKSESGNTFLGFTPVGNGGCYLIATYLEPGFTNFQQHALFVPVFLKPAIMGASEIQSGKTTGVPSEFSAGDTLLSGDQVYHVTNPTIGFDVIATARKQGSRTYLSLFDQVKTAGNYAISANSKQVNAVAFNYNRKESDLETASIDDVQKLFSSSVLSSPEVLDPDAAPLNHTVSKIQSGTSLWKVFILLTLIFLAIEVLLIRFLKS